MIRVDGKSVPLLLMCMVLVMATVINTLNVTSASAAQITDRSMTLMAGVTDGGSKPGGVVRHQFDFTLPTAGNVGSIRFEYCTTASGTCTVPTGLVTTSSTLDDQQGAIGFTLVNATNGTPYITRTAAAIAANQVVSYRLASVTNPTATNTAFYVRIASFASTDTTGSATDTGTVTTSTATQIVLTGIMPESLIFCTGGTVGTTSGVPDCSTATGGSVSFNQLFSPTDTATTTSQMAASTNAGFGYAITVNGTTMTSGSNTIASMASATTGVKGTAQFGMNLKANTVSTSNPAVGTEVAPAANGSSLRGQPATGYDTSDTFKFTSGESVANSSNNPTNAQIFTSSYIVNVPGNQPAGTYTTTLTYVATATF